MKNFLKQNWFKFGVIFVAIIIGIAMIYYEREVTVLNKWSRLCSNVSTTELRFRGALDLKMGDREKEWCKNTFYNFFK